jgi:hypothetical protein
MILKDIWGLPDREVERIALWMADALIDAAQRDAARAARRPAPGAQPALGTPAAGPPTADASPAPRRRRPATTNGAGSASPRRP